MSGRFWDSLNLGLPIVLSVMGAAMALWPPSMDSKGRIFWACSFLVVGGIAWIAALQSSNSLKDDLTEMFTGGDNYCYFKIRLADAANLTGPFQLWMIAPKGPVFDLNFWISPASAKGADDPAYKSLDVRKPLNPIIHSGGHAWDRVLDQGEYLIEFDAKNGHWDEILRIFADGQKLRQTIKIVGLGGKTLYQATPD